MICEKCNDTGSLLKNLHSMLDCPYCDTAAERASLADQARGWVREHDPVVCLWLAYQQGRAATRQSKTE